MAVMEPDPPPDLQKFPSKDGVVDIDDTNPTQKESSQSDIRSSGNVEKTAAMTVHLLQEHAAVDREIDFNSNSVICFEKTPIGDVRETSNLQHIRNSSDFTVAIERNEAATVQGNSGESPANRTAICTSYGDIRDGTPPGFCNPPRGAPHTKSPTPLDDGGAGDTLSNSDVGVPATFELPDQCHLVEELNTSTIIQKSPPSSKSNLSNINSNNSGGEAISGSGGAAACDGENSKLSVGFVDDHTRNTINQKAPSSTTPNTLNLEIRVAPPPAGGGAAAEPQTQNWQCQTAQHNEGSPPMQKAPSGMPHFNSNLTFRVSNLSSTNTSGGAGSPAIGKNIFELNFNPQHQTNPQEQNFSKKDPSNNSNVDSSLDPKEKTTGTIFPVNAQNKSQSKSNPHTLRNEINQTTQFLGTSNSNSKIPTCVTRGENSLIVPEAVLVDRITTLGNPSTSTNPKHTNHPPVSDFPPISSNFQKFDPKNSKNPIVSFTPSALPPKTKSPNNQPTTTNHPPPPIAKQSMATRLRAKQAEHTTRIDLTPPKRVTKQGCPAIMFKREDYMVKMAESCKYTLIGKFYSPIPKMEVPLEETTTTNQEGSRKAQEDSTNQNRNQISNNQWETQKRRNFKGKTQTVQNTQTIQGNTQQHEHQPGIDSMLPIPHGSPSSFNVLNVLTAAAEVVNGGEDGGIQEKPTNLQEGHSSSQHVNKRDSVDAQTMASKLPPAVTIGCETTVDSGRLSSPSLRTEQQQFRSVDVGANQSQKMTQQVAQNLVHNRATQMQKQRPADAPIPTKKMTNTAAPYQPQNSQENRVHNKATQMQGSRPAAAGLEQNLHGFGPISASTLKEKSVQVVAPKLISIQHNSQGVDHTENVENDQHYGCSFSITSSDQTSSLSSHQVQHSNSKQKDNATISGIEFSASPSPYNQQATSKTLRKKRTRKKKQEKKQEAATPTPPTTADTGGKDNNGKVFSNSCSQYVLLDQSTPIRSPDFSCEDPLNLTPLNIQPAPFTQPENATNILCTNNDAQTSTPDSDDEYGVIHSEDEYDQDFQGEVELENEEETDEQSNSIATPSKTTTKVTNDEMNQLANKQGLSPRGIHHNPKFTTIHAPISRPNTRLHNLRSHQ
ncbi:uncharacterized protein LOC129894642 [Solanum dulcamara]|uniref:uncharacterized protein LOC129894642 n=1 Tax=Solanum dulcamara TaxID=45834 RepID=UPI002484EE18|nr:uncharacterized protein LOC129894642 [Solanum dulcamara]